MGTPIAPRTPEEIAATARACFDAGAAIVHNHIDIVGDAATRGRPLPRGMGSRAGRTARRARCIPPSTASATTRRGSATSHRSRSRGVLRIGLIDPGSVNLGSLLHLRERRRIASSTSGRCASSTSWGRRWRSSNPGSCGPRCRCGAPGTLPAGAMIRFYFGGDGARGERRLLVRPAAHRGVAGGVPRDARRLSDPLVGGGARRRPLRLRPPALRARARRSPPGRPRGLRGRRVAARTSSSSRRPSTRWRARVSSSRRAPTPRRCWDCARPVAAGASR